MFNAKDILGALMNNGMSQSSQRRLEHSLGDQGVGGQNGILGQMLGKVTGGSSGGGGLLSSLGNIAGSMFGNKQNNAQGSSSGMGTSGAGVLGALAGSLLGGGGGSVKGALGGGALAMLGSLALQAYKNYSAQGNTQGSSAQPDAASQLMAGLRQPENDQEEQEVQDIAMLTLKAMINAAKADGHVDEQETQRILGKLQEDGITSEEQQFVIDEMKKPIDTDSIINAVPNPQVGAQIYAASLLAIEVDTDAERNYMEQLASRLGLDNNVVNYLHSAVGAA